jgi:hypothetical protein
MQRNGNVIVLWEDIPQETRDFLIELDGVTNAPVWDCRNMLTVVDLEKITPLLEKYYSMIYEEGQDGDADEVQKVIGQLDLIFLNKGVASTVSDDLTSH